MMGAIRIARASLLFLTVIHIPSAFANEIEKRNNQIDPLKFVGDNGDIEKDILETVIRQEIASDNYIQLQNSAPINVDTGIGEGARVQAIATQDGGQISLRYSFSNTKSLLTDVKKSILAFDNYVFEAERSFTGDNRDITLASLDGIENGTSFSGQWIRYVTAVNYGKLANDQKSKYIQLAEDKCLQENAGLEPKERNTLCDKYGENNQPDVFIRRYLKIDPDPVIFDKYTNYYGVRIEGSQQQFNFLDSDNFRIENDSEFGFSAEAFFGRIIGSGLNSIELSTEYSKSFRSNNDIQICQPTAGTMQLQCLEGANGAPVEVERGLFSISSTLALYGSESKEKLKFGIAPNVTYDALSDGYEVDLPIYFVPNDDGALTGGIRATYTNSEQMDGSRDGNFTVGIFVGLAFGQNR